MQYVHKNPATGEDHSVEFFIDGLELAPSAGVMYSSFSPSHRLQISVGSKSIRSLIELVKTRTVVNFQIIAYVDGVPIKIEDVDVVVESVKAETIMSHTGIVMTVTLKELNQGE